jgi:UDP-N-acetylmuramate--alanine ligase
LLYAYKGIRPQLGSGVFVAPSAQVIGRVLLGTEASAWFNAVLRGDTETITVGAESNIQDGTVVHVDPGFPTTIGRGVTVGHSCIIHGCTIGDNSLIGMGTTILNGARLGENCLVGAGSLVTEGKEFPPGSVIMGRPAKVVRQVEERDLAMMARGAANYRRNAADYAIALTPVYGASENDDTRKAITHEGGSQVLKAQKVHFIAIGGYGMSGLAMVLLKAGVRVSGSDVAESERTEKLKQAGAEVHIGRHDAAYVEGADVVVYSTDVPGDNPEMAAARQQGLRVMHRSELLATFINRGAGIAMAGTHGKTTTTTMVALLLERGGLDPTVLVGGEMPAIGGTGKAGKGPHVVAEADESDRSFLRYFPQVTVVNNVEAEHLEHWDGKFENIVAGFRQYLSQVQSEGLAILNGDDPTLRMLGEELQGRPGASRVVFYGTGGTCTWQARNIHPWEGGIAYDCVKDGQVLGEVRLPVPGRHNAMNSLGAIVAGDHVGLPFERMQEILAGFGNAKRRYQVWAHVDGVTVVDDYAHHPTEIRATLSAAKEQAGRRVVAVFQPQRYSRTHWLMDEFATAFGDADVLVLTKIYSPPGERPIPGVSAEALAGRIEANTGRPILVESEKPAILEFLLKTIQPGDTVLTMGAGDIWTVARDLARELKERSGVV